MSTIKGNKSRSTPKTEPIAIPTICPVERPSMGVGDSVVGVGDSVVGVGDSVVGVGDSVVGVGEITGTNVTLNPAFM